MKIHKMLSQVFILVVFTATTSVAQHASPPIGNPVVNFAYKYSDPKVLYALSDMQPIESSGEAEDLLSQGIVAAKLNQFVGICVYTTGFAGVIQLMQYTMSGAQGHHKSIAASFFTGLLWGGAYMSGFMEMVSDTMNAPLRWLTGLIVSLPSDELRALEVKFLHKKHTIPEGSRENIGRRFFALRTGVEPYSAAAKDYLTAVLSLPTISTRPIFHKDKLEEAFAGFHPDVKRQLTAASWLLSGGNTSSDQKKVLSSGQKQAFYFLGEPGTGKTYGAGALAKVLGLPVCEIDLAGKKPQDLTGTAGAGVGDITQCMIDTQTLNPIIIFNDADRALNQQGSGFADFFLSLTDRERKTMKNAYLGWDVDISQLTFILTANYALGRSDKDKPPSPSSEFDALQERLTLRVTFVETSKENKKIIIQKHLHQFLQDKECAVAPGILSQKVDEALDENKKGAASLRKYIVSLQEEVAHMCLNNMMGVDLESEKQDQKLFSISTRGRSGITPGRALNGGEEL